ncbi:MAG: sugar kinase [Candidatus Aenigmarchaeota archaeon]|nr:sugar kinase [Candidatus Aenigmarchaeota archaeon]
MGIDVIGIGSLALDSVKTPFGQFSEGLGGTTSYFSLASSFFSKTGIVSTVGKDFPSIHKEFLLSRGVDIEGISEETGKTLRWHASYDYEMNEAHTDLIELNVFGNMKTTIPESYRSAKFVYFGPIDPSLPTKFLSNFPSKPFTVMDTKNIWLKRREELMELCKAADIFLLNEWEARELFQTSNLVIAAKKALSAGAKNIIIKKGEHGALLFSNSSFFFVPGYPLENVVDPTGAGDCFAGGLLGFLAKTGITKENLRKAMVYGSVIASFCAEGLGIERLKILTMEQIENRYKEFQRLVKF